MTPIRRAPSRIEISGVRVGVAVRSDPVLQGFSTRLAAYRIGGRRVGVARASYLVERLLLHALRELAQEADGEAGARVARVAELRTEVRERFDRVRQLFAPSAPGGPIPHVSRLPAELQPRALRALFDELGEAQRDLEAMVARRRPQEMFKALERDPDDWVTVLGRAEERGAAEAPEDLSLAADLPLDRPEDLQRRIDRSDPDRRAARRAGSDADRTALATYRERMRLQPPPAWLRRAVVRDADAWRRRGALPAGAEIVVVRIPDYSMGNLAAMRRFARLDPRFSGRGFELKIELEGFRAFQPDGVHWFDDLGRRYLFLESKEVYVWNDEGGGYASPTGQARLAEMLARDAEIARRLHPYGCEGFRYETNDPRLDDFLARTIADMVASGSEGAKLLWARKLEDL
jgi:hypothetical protein